MDNVTHLGLALHKDTIAVGLLLRVLPCPITSDRQHARGSAKACLEGRPSRRSAARRALSCRRAQANGCALWRRKRCCRNRLLLPPVHAKIGHDLRVTRLESASQWLDLQRTFNRAEAWQHERPSTRSEEWEGS